MNKLLTNQITALYIGKTDLHTGKWFPFHKITWERKRDNNYFDLFVTFIEGSKAFRQLYPNSERVLAYGKVRKYRDINYGPLRNRLPLSRPLGNKHKLLYGFDLDEEVDPVEFGVISGGYRHGDRKNLFPELAPDQQGDYNFVFSGVDAWYLPEKNRPQIEKIPVGAEVTLQLPEKEEIQQGEWEEHTAPPESIRMKMYAEDQLVGYAPPHIRDLFGRFGEKLQVVICQKNLGAVFDEQFLFKATINQSAGIPFSDQKYQIFMIDSQLSSTL